jgi:hypothetical protein
VFVLISISALNWVLLSPFKVRVYYALIPLLLSIQLLLHQLLERLLVSKAGGSKWFAVLVFPGTVVHELSHAVAALVSGCRLTSLSLFTFNRSGVLGSVTYASKGGRLSFVRDLFISLSPFFGCSIAMMAVSRHLLGRVVSLNQFPITLEALPDRVFGLLAFLAGGYSIGSLSIGLVFAFYLQLCFAFGAAPSSFDFDGLWSSLRKNLSGLLVLLPFMAFIAFLAESPQALGQYGAIAAGAVAGVLDWTVFLLSFSIAMLLFSLLFFYSASLWLESSLALKLASILLSIAAYFTCEFFLQDGLSLPLAWLFGVAVIMLSKNARFFIKPRRSG